MPNRPGKKAQNRGPAGTGLEAQYKKPAMPKTKKTTTDKRANIATGLPIPRKKSALRAAPSLLAMAHLNFRGHAPGLCAKFSLFAWGGGGGGAEKDVCIWAGLPEGFHRTVPFQYLAMRLFQQSKFHNLQIRAGQKDKGTKTMTCSNQGNLVCGVPYLQNALFCTVFT